MTWKRRAFVAGGVLLCTSFLVSAVMAGDPAAKKQRSDTVMEMAKPHEAPAPAVEREVAKAPAVQVERKDVPVADRHSTILEARQSDLAAKGVIETVSVMSVPPAQSAGRATCQHSIDLIDAYGDGWNGGTVDVLVEGVVVLDEITLASGAGPASFQFTANDGDLIEVQLSVPGSYPEEMIYVVYDDGGYEIFSEGPGIIGGSGTGACPCAVAPPAVDDNCGDVTPLLLADGVPAQFTGDNTCATNDCALYSGSFTWIAFELPASASGWNVTLDYCDTVATWANGFTQLATGCPCATLSDPASFETTSCANAGFTLNWTGLADGTYYYPMLLDPANGAVGPYTINVVAEAIVATGGDNCAMPQTLSLPADLNYADSNTTCGRLDDYNATCMGSYDGAEDMIYELVVTDTVCVDISVNADSIWGGIAVGDTCPLAASGCLATATTSANPDVIRNLLLDPGVYYLMVDDWPTPNCIDFDLTIEPCATGACCNGTCSEVSAPECAALGGSYLGDGTTCDPDPCQTGACCFDDGSCQELSDLDCSAAGGNYSGNGTNCTPNLCPQPCVCDVTTGGFCADFGDTAGDLGLWTQSADDDIDWTLLSGPTVSGSTGPQGDHTTGTGFYAYIETSSPAAAGDVAILDAPCVDLSTLTDPEVTFWYHMYGATMGTVEFQVSGDNCLTWDTLFSASGDQGDIWRLGQVSLAAYAGQTIHARFVGVVGSSFTGDAAIDDICFGEAQLFDGGCCDLDTGACLGFIDEATCLGLGNTAWNVGADCTVTNFCPQPPPVNDLCDDAIDIPAVPYVQPNVQFQSATDDTNVDLSCDSSTCTSVNNGVWWTYTPAIDCDATVGNFVQDFATGVFVDTTGLGDCDNLTQVVCSDPDPFSFPMEGGVTYYILAAKWTCTGEPTGPETFAFDCISGACCNTNGTCTEGSAAGCAADGGTFVGAGSTCADDPCNQGACCLDSGCITTTGVECANLGGIYQGDGTSCQTAVCNDDCADREVVIEGVPAAEGDNCAASDIDDAEAGCQANSGRDVWFEYTASCTGTVTIDTEGSGQSDTVLSLYFDCGGTELLCDDDGGTSLLSSMSFNTVAGTTFAIRMASYSDGCGDYNLNITCDEAPQGVCCSNGLCSIDYQLTCELGGGVYGGDDTVCAGNDCNANGSDDACEILEDPTLDCNVNGVPDDCDIAGGTSTDCDGNGTPDECDPDCNANGVADGCDITGGTSDDCQPDGIPDECQLGDAGRAACGGIIFDNGPGDLVNGTRPAAGWTDGGVADDFAIASGADSSVGCFRFDMFGTVGMADLQTVQVRIYSAPAGLAGLGSFAAAVPVFDQTYSVGDGTLAISDTGLDAFGFDLLRFEASGPAVDIGSGNFALHLSFPGSAAVGYWATAGSDTSECAIIWGPTIDTPSDACAGGGDFTQLSFTILGGGSSGSDCNTNGIPDDCDIAAGTGEDCDANGTIDECEFLDCDNNGVHDPCDILQGADDCQPDGIPDKCQTTDNDCDGNGVPDECDLVTDPDCNANGIIDFCEILAGTSEDCQPDGVPDECQLGTVAGDIIVDGSFEGGTPNATWTEESTNFGTPLCDEASCGLGGTTGARTGDWWAWFGGVSLGQGTLPEIGALEQDVVIPAAATTVSLEFYLEIPTASSNGVDYLEVLVDGNSEFIVLENAAGYATWALVQVDLSAYADDATHTVRFVSQVDGPDVTNFFVDDVALLTAGAGANDCNANGIPDECDNCADLNGDGLVDGVDYQLFRDTYGRVAADPAYNLCADYDGSGAVGLVDFQAWLACYRTFVNNPHAMPPALPGSSQLRPTPIVRPGDAGRPTRVTPTQGQIGSVRP